MTHPPRTMGIAAARVATVAAATALVVAALIVSASAQPPPRLAGDDRFATAAAVAEEVGADGVAVVASGTRFADALAVAPAAAAEAAPVLLVTRDHAPATTLDTLGRLDVDEVWVVGGTGAVSNAVADDAADAAGADVVRISGGGRFATAAAVADRTHPDGAATAYLASGAAFPDGLSAGAAAASDDAPLLLATQGTLPEPTARALAGLDPDEVVVVGGTAAISEGVATSAADAAGADLTRVAGADRFATAAEVATRRLSDAEGAWLATGEAFPDALAASAAAGREGDPVLLSRAPCLPNASADALEALGVGDALVVVGGRAAIGDAAAEGRRCGIVPETVVEGLEIPWDVAWTDDGRAFVTERDTGRLLQVDPGTGSATEVATFDVDSQGEGGLLGLTAHPDGEQLYVYYSAAAHGDNRVVRFSPGAADAEIIVDGIPHASIHNGGRIAFGPDGDLYVATGDAGESSRAQDPSSLAGKILRVTPDGAVPPDNPIAGSPVYATGLRNVQGLAWDADGRLLATEFGPGCDDEVNLIVAGGNYGWPDPCGETREGAIEPVIVRQPPVASWSGATIPRRSAVPEWDGQLLAAALRGERLWRFALDGGTVTGAAETFVGDYGRLRHVEQAPDGSLWLLTSNRDGRGDPRGGDDRIVRVAPPRS